MDGNLQLDLNAAHGASQRYGLFARPIMRRALRADVLLLAFDALSALDLLSVAFCGFGCAALRSDLTITSSLGEFPSTAGLQLTVAGAMLAPAVLRSRPARTAFDAQAATSLLSVMSQRFTLWVALVLGIAFLSRDAEILPRSWLLAWVASSYVLLVAGRLGAVAMLRAATAHGLLRDRVAVLGAGPVAGRLFRQLRAARHRGVELAYTSDLSHGGPGGFERAVDEVVELGRRGGLDRVVLALPDMTDARMLDAVLRLKALDVEVSHCPSALGLAGVVRAAEVGGAPLLVLAGRPLQHGGRVFKSAFDRTVALLAILFLSPLLALAALAVWLDSPGPVIFRQDRYGWNNTPFAVLKFRTMRSGPGTGRFQQTRRGDARVTRVGRVLRMTSLDELPQLFNVLNGTMSLVGPRPHPVLMRTEDRLGEEIVAEYSHRHRVKPGITGWAQIHGFRGATETAEQVRCRVEHDLFYIDNWSFSLDLRILLLTPFRVVFQRSNAF